LKNLLLILKEGRDNLPKVDTNTLKKIKNAVNNFGAAFFEKLGYLLNPVILRFKTENKQLLVFYFHGLFECVKQKDLNLVYPQNNMTVAQFVDVIEYFLGHNYKFILPDDLIKGLENNQPYAMITFDDGYFNNMPGIEILNKYKVPAVFFITTRNMMENKSYWWDVIYKYRAKQGNSQEKIESEIMSLKGFKYDFIDDYILKNFGMDSFKPWSDISRPFTPTEIKELAKNAYLSFGNHTHNHSILTNYNKEEIKEELSVSNKILFDLTGALPNTIAFPNGNFNQMVLETTEEEGFQYAFTTEPYRNLFPIDNKKFTTLNRYMTNTMRVTKFGGACRLGYRPHALYHDLKTHAKSVLKLNR
jgi:peptidoglycan/xylan/chitin deacetylase (PgdA/CDA1 family)